MSSMKYDKTWSIICNNRLEGEYIYIYKDVPK